MMNSNQMQVGSDFTDQQRLVALRKKQREVDRMWRELRESSEDGYRYLRKLMLELYQADAEGREMTKGEACAAIPAKHDSTCHKYVEFAQSERLIQFKKHPVDKRKVLVLPTSKLKKLVEEDIKLECVEIKSLAKAFNSE